MRSTLLKQIAVEEIYSWFNYDKMEEFRTCTSYLGMEDTLAYLQKVFAEQGPFDGVLGFRLAIVINFQINSADTFFRLTHTKPRWSTSEHTLWNESIRIQSRK